MSFFYGKMKRTFVAFRINLVQDVLNVVSLLSQKVHDSACITYLAKFKENANVSETSWSYWGPRFPLVIEIALLESFNYLELVGGHPIFMRVFAEVLWEVTAQHGAGKLFGGKWSKALFHELEYDLLVRVIIRYDWFPADNWRQVALFRLIFCFLVLVFWCESQSILSRLVIFFRHIVLEVVIFIVISHLSIFCAFFI